MNKYERLIRSDDAIKAAVIDILKILDGRNFSDVEQIIGCAKYFALEQGKQQRFEYDKVYIDGE